MITIPLGKQSLSHYHMGIIGDQLITASSFSTPNVFLNVRNGLYSISVEDKYVAQEKHGDKTIYRIKYNGKNILQFDVTEKDGEYVVKITPEDPKSKPQPQAAVAGESYKQESKECEAEATQRQRTRHSSTQEDPALTTFKKDIVAILNKYSSTVQFTMFGHPLEFNYKFITCGNYGHHHEGRVRAVINAINHPNTTKDDVLTILRRQHNLMTKSDVELNWNIHKEVSYEILAKHWQDEYPKRRYLTPESQKTSGFLKVINEALAKAEPQPEARQQRQTVI